MAQTEQLEVLKTPEEWQKECDFTVFDPDGWRETNTDWNTLITNRRFHQLASRSTLKFHRLPAISETIDPSSTLETVRKQRAERLGLSVEESIIRDREALRNSSYPSTECINVHVLYSQSEEAKKILAMLAHILHCPMCAAMVEVHHRIQNEAPAEIDGDEQDIRASRDLHHR